MPSETHAKGTGAWPFFLSNGLTYLVRFVLQYSEFYIRINNHS